MKDFEPIYLTFIISTSVFFVLHVYFGTYPELWVILQVLLLFAVALTLIDLVGAWKREQARLEATRLKGNFVSQVDIVVSNIEHIITEERLNKHNIIINLTPNRDELLKLFEIDEYIELLCGLCAYLRSDLSYRPWNNLDIEMSNNNYYLLTQKHRDTLNQRVLPWIKNLSAGYAEVDILLKASTKKSVAEFEHVQLRPHLVALSIGISLSHIISIALGFSA